MNKNKKLALITGSVVAAVTVLTVGSLALFTARTEGDFSAQAGTVAIAIDDVFISNSKNVNPGDNDPSNPGGAAYGTDHDLSYEISNNGTKSIRTRQTIILTADNGGSLLDARYLALYKNGSELTTKTYILSDGSETSSVNSNQKVTAVKYVFLSDIFDGKGVSIEQGGNAEKETASNVVKQGSDGNVAKEYSYDFALLRTAGNEYQGCNIKATVAIEAMQYRNTAVSDWTSAAIVEKSYSSAGVEVNVVPDSNEDKNGNNIQ